MVKCQERRLMQDNQEMTFKSRRYPGRVKLEKCGADEFLGGQEQLNINSSQVLAFDG